MQFTVAVAEHYTVPLFVPAGTSGDPQGVLRILNDSDASGTVTVYAIDDTGTRSGPVTFTLNSWAAAEFDATVLANGNATTGLTGSLGTGTGDWRLEIETDLSIEPLAYVRAADGTLSVMHDTVRGTEVAGVSTFHVSIFNPSTNVTQASRIRLINPGDAVATVTIGGRDDTGAVGSGGQVQLTIPANGARTLTAQQLEAGDASVTGQLGAGVGRWRLSVSADRPIQVVNVAVTSAGVWNNLSTTAVRGPAPADHGAFNERFDGLDVVYETDGGRFTLSVQAGDRLTETGESDGTAVSRSGGYLFAGIGPDAGRLRLEYDDGNACAANFYFASRTGGWFASHCTGSDDPDGRWLGGTWYVDDDVDTSPAFAGDGQGDRSYRTGTAIDALMLPEATGGDGMLTYGLSPDVPGLSFDDETRELSGTPTEAGTYAMTYTVTDSDGDTDTLTFTLAVVSTDSVAEGVCHVGLIVGIGESCTYPGTEDEFTVNVRGRGRFLASLAGIRIRIDNETIDGRVYDFEASHQGDGVWRIERVAASTEPPSAEDSDGDGLPNVSDPDDDNDGTPDTDDPCPLDGADACDDATSVASLEVSGATPLTSTGQTIQLAATAHMLDDSSQAIASAFVHWESSDPAVATVIDGTVTAVGGGHARIVATYRGRKAVAEISVHISLRETGTVRVLYAAPSDRAFRSDYRDAVQHAIVDLQSWFRRQTGGLTFSIYDTTPEQCQLGEASDFYRLNAWQKVLDGVQHCAPVEGGTSAYTWVVYADVDMVCNAPNPLRRGGPGLAMLPHEDMEGLIGNRLLYYGVCGAGPWPGPVTLWNGVLGHELGHALRLTEPPGCEERLPTCDREELMHLGATVYPHTYLRPDNKEVLLRSPFVGRDPAHRPLTGDAAQAVTIGGTVMDPDGNVVEGIRISAIADTFWGWGQSETDGMFEIRLPEDAAGSTVLSVHSGGVADCGWLGYHHAGGLTTLREQAIRIELDDFGPTDIEITLPAIAGELCRGQRTISGTVLGPEGEPARVWVNAFDRWSSTGDDGLFEIRLPDISEGSGRASPLLIYAQECRHLGFYGPGGFTTRPDDATRFEFGAVDVAGIEIRLPATEELCGRQIAIAGTVVGPDGNAVEGIGLEAEPFARRGTSAADGTFEIRLLEGSVGMAVLAVRADCGRVGYYGPDGFTRSREDATGIDVGEGNVTGIEIRLPSEVNELCG